MIYYYLFVTLFIGLELQKLIQFKFFFKILSLTTEYKKKFLDKAKTFGFYKKIIQFAFIDISYVIMLGIGLFTINRYFFCAILTLLVIQSLIFKLKYKTIKKIFYITNIVLSIILLTLATINFIFYQLDGIEFIKQLLKL